MRNSSSAASRSLQPMITNRLAPANQKYTGSSLSQSESRSDSKRHEIMISKVTPNVKDASSSSVKEYFYSEPDDTYLQNMKIKLVETLEEYVNKLSDLKAVVEEVEKIFESFRWCIPRELYSTTLEKSEKYRKGSSEIFIHLITQTKLLNIAQFKYGFKEILNCAQDTCIDIPLFWNYISEILGKYTKTCLII